MHSPLLRPPPHLPTHLVWTGETGPQTTVVYSVINNRHVKKIRERILTLGLSMHGSTLASSSTLSFLWFFFLFFFLIWFTFIFPIPSFSPHLYLGGKFIGCYWTVSYRRRRLCPVITAASLSLAGSGPAPHPMASRMSLRIWYWGNGQTGRGASPSDGRSGDSESRWGTFPCPPEQHRYETGERQWGGNRLYKREKRVKMQIKVKQYRGDKIKKKIFLWHFRK